MLRAVNKSFMLSVVMLSVVMLNFVMVSVMFEANVKRQKWPNFTNFWSVIHLAIFEECHQIGDDLKINKDKFYPQ